MIYSKIKRLFFDFFQEHEFFESQLVCLRPYNPNTDCVVESFTNEDWKLMFPNVNKDSFNRWAQDDIHLVLSGLDRETKQQFGILVFEQMKNPDYGVYVHGGTWKPNLKSNMLAYDGLHSALQYLIDNGFEIYSSCFTKNLRADKFLKDFGFVEFLVEEDFSYKFLELDKFTNNDILNRLERILHQNKWQKHNN